MHISYKVSLATAVLVLMGPLTAFALTPAVAPNLNTAASFSVFAGSSMSSDGSGATISSDLGLNPGVSTDLTGTWTHTAGSNYFGTSGLSGTAKIDATAAYTSMNRTNQAGGTIWNPVTDLAPLPGLYKADSNPTITGELILNGTASDVWMFQIEDSLTFAGGATVTLQGDASACNVYWYIKSSATINGTSGKKFVGTLIANSSVSLIGGPVILGRMMALTGSLTTVGGPNISGCASGTIAPQIGSVPTVPAVFPLINVTKIPSPLSLPTGPGPVTYTYKVTNIGVVPVTNVSVKDDMCSPVHFVSGDANKDGLLDVAETWTYNCFKTVSKTETNTVTACATAANSSSSGTLCDTAEATVVVGATIIPPLIHVVKTPSVFFLPSGGGAVTYSYAITNPGTAPLHDVSISDNKCTGLPGRVVGHPGDINKNNLLDTGETWQFTCKTNLTQTTTNIGTATGSANGFTATDSSPAIVVVAAPSLPNTGLPPFGADSARDATLVTGILMAILVSFVVLKRRSHQ